MLLSILTVQKYILWGTTKSIRLRRIAYVTKRYELASEFQSISRIQGGIDGDRSEYRKEIC